MKRLYVILLCSMIVSGCGSATESEFPEHELVDEDFSELSLDSLLTKAESSATASTTTGYHSIVVPLDSSVLPISTYRTRHFSVKFAYEGSSQFFSIDRTTTPQVYILSEPYTSSFRLQAQRLIPGTTYHFEVTGNNGVQRFTYPIFVATTQGSAPLNPSDGAIALPLAALSFPFDITRTIAADHLLEFSMTRNTNALPSYRSYKLYQCALDGGNCVELKNDTVPRGRIFGSIANNNFRFLLTYLTPGTRYRMVVCASTADDAQTDCSAPIEEMTTGPVPIALPSLPEPEPEPEPVPEPPLPAPAPVPVPPAPAPVCNPWPQNMGNLAASSLVVSAPADSQWYPSVLGQTHFKFSFNNYLRPECDTSYATYQVYASPAGSGCWTRIDATTTPSATFTYDWCSITGVLVEVAGITVPTDIILRVSKADFSESITVPVGVHSAAGAVAPLQGIAGLPGPVINPSPTPSPIPQPTPAPSPAPGTGNVIDDPSVIAQQSTFSLPSYDSLFVDPVFGTSLRRVTNRVSQGGFGTQIYSQLQAFSTDNQYLLLIEDDTYVVRRRDTLAAMSVNLTNINAPRWHPMLAHTIVAYDSNGDTSLGVLYIDVDSGSVTPHFTFPSSYQRIRSNQSFDELSENGMWMAGMASMQNGDQHLFALNLQTQSLGASISLNGLYNSAICAPDPQWGNLEPDWVGVSPAGRYLMVQWKRDGTSRCSGLESFDISTGTFVGRVYDGHQHGDLGIRADGSEFFMVFELYHPSGQLSLGVRDLPGSATASAPSYVQQMSWGHGGHISCRGPAGSCLVTTSVDQSNGWNALEGEIFLQYVDGRVRRLAHHRSTSCGYWVQPRASISRDGRYAIFASDFGAAHCSGNNLGRGEAYLLNMP
ncbi:MAG: hypothetical protein A3I05_01745 [Deltaproteobacteria bacterium RIFCSPLOWO2_02_FULL_44_10]|nr:MAG: hypothetical protein A3C46_05340 [Deltaproteobacteria bacterium RIFCSPHIGHO2_02_FULL_44_16]OGQ45370.1 MAG: hypothetical protein A3I05_01745 [Deltaproteobacteria bacterium RIFCSPLOWO2_02_FULL_44_10]